MRPLVWGALFLLLSSSLPAQELVRHIEVVGQAEVRLAPDQAVVTLGVETWNADLALARQENGVKMNRLLAVPLRFGVLASDVKTDFASVQPDYQTDERGRTTSIAGYRVAQGLSMVIRDIRVVDPLVTAAFGAGVNRLEGVTFGLADPRKAAADARLAAVRDARSKAEALAGELGAKLGRVLVVTDLGASAGGPEPRFKAATLADAGGDQAFAPGLVVVGAQVSVWFELRD